MEAKDFMQAGVREPPPTVNKPHHENMVRVRGGCSTHSHRAIRNQTTVMRGAVGTSLHA